MKKLIAIVSVMLLLIVACNKEEAVEAAPVETAPADVLKEAVEEVVPAEIVE